MTANLTIQTVSTTTATATAITSLIYYVMSLEARFYDYLAWSDVKPNKKHSSKRVQHVESHLLQAASHVIESLLIIL
jgi:hypothetical protein